MFVNKGVKEYWTLFSKSIVFVKKVPYSTKYYEIFHHAYMYIVDNTNHMKASPGRLENSSQRCPHLAIKFVPFLKEESKTKTNLPSQKFLIIKAKK